MLLCSAASAINYVLSRLRSRQKFQRVYNTLFTFLKNFPQKFNLPFFTFYTLDLFKYVEKLHSKCVFIYFFDRFFFFFFCIFGIGV